VVDVLPHASTAFHVLVSVRTPTELIDVTSEIRFTVAVVQASDAVGGVKTGVAVHSIVAFAPADPIVGGVLSITVIV
jgi:hypothetical protein